MPKLTIGQNLRETLDNSFTETFGNKPERYFFRSRPYGNWR